MTSRNAGLRTSRRFAAFVAAVVVLGMAVLFNTTPAAAAPVRAPGDLCSVDQWQDPGNFAMCVGKLKDLTTAQLQCLSPPTPETPDAGMSGWFASQPPSSQTNGAPGKYTTYGYAGYDYTMYDVGCVSPVTHPANSFENTIANGEFMVATSIIGSSDALREKAWSPSSLWGWADTLVDRATKSIYHKVFTVFGAITLAVVGLYLLWRSRQSDMSNAMTTAGWAVLVMVAVTALAAYPVRAAQAADSTLVGGLSVVHNAIGPDDGTPQPCADPVQNACIDNRPPAVRASDTVTDTILYRNWLRGLLGSADSPTAIKYGPILYDSRAFTWAEALKIEKNPSTRDATIAQKQQEWLKVSAQIKTEDPQAYEYLRGNQGMDRIGAGFIAILSALFFALFDIVASILVLIGFLIFRWAIIAAPVLGTVGLLRPASSGIRRLANAVVAAMLNIIIFGAGASVYLFAVDLIMNTPSLPGWLQVVLVGLVGVVGWILLRPYRRLTTLTGRDPAAGLSGGLTRRFFRDAREASRSDGDKASGGAEPRTPGQRARGELEVRSTRPEARSEDGGGAPQTTPPTREPATTSARRPAGEWTDPDVPDGPTNYGLYRPDGAHEPVRVKRPESSSVPG